MATVFMRKEKVAEAMRALMEAFDWITTPQKLHYWQEVYENLVSLREEADSLPPPTVNLTVETRLLRVEQAVKRLENRLTLATSQSVV